MSCSDHSHDERPEFNPDDETAGSILSALATVFMLAGAVIVAKEKLLDSDADISRNGGTHGSPTLIEESK